MTTVTDSFSGTGALSANWLRNDGAASDHSRDNGIRSVTLGLGTMSLWVANTFGSNQRARITVGVTPPTEWGIGPLLKATNGTDNGYRFSFTASRIYVERIPTGGAIIDVTGLTIAAADQLELTAEVSGANLLIKAFQNGVQRGATYTDTTPHTGNRIGLASRYADTVYRGVDFDGGDVAVPSSLSGSVQADDAVGSGSLAPTPPSNLTGNIQADDAVATGALATQLSTLITLPFSRNPGAGARPVSIANVALAVLTDDINLARLVSSTGILMGSNGRLTLASAVPAPPGTRVVVVTREPDGKLGVERYVLS